MYVYIVFVFQNRRPLDLNNMRSSLTPGAFIGYSQHTHGRVKNKLTCYSKRPNRDFHVLVLRAIRTVNFKNDGSVGLKEI